MARSCACSLPLGAGDLEGPPEGVPATGQGALVGLELDDIGCFLDLFFLASCDENDCLYAGMNDILTDPIPPGTYYIVVDGMGTEPWEAEECPFILTVTCQATEPECCPLLSECYVYDFDESNNGFETLDCGGASVWEWGTAPFAGDDCDGGGFTKALGTVLLGEYPPDAGEAAVIGPVSITEDCSCMELCHMFDIEEGFDGGNVKVSTDGGATWDPVRPNLGYDSPTSADAACIPQELAFSERMSDRYRDCFDLSAYIGQEIDVGFFFGSDYGNPSPYAGWYILSVKFGTDSTPVESVSWGVIKAMYR